MSRRRFAFRLVPALLLLAPGALAATPPDSGAAIASGLEAAAARAGLGAEPLRLALRAYARAMADGLTDRPVLTVIDYTLRSRERRLWVLDLRAGRVLAHERVAHGRLSGDDRARHFSNRPGSHQTSLGTFLTGPTYRGKHGLSLRLKGLDRGINHLAEARAIVVHGADYVNEAIVRQLGRLGRSQGCPALSRDAAPRIIELIRGGTVVFAYHASAGLERIVASR